MIIQTGADLTKCVRTEGPANATLYLYEQFDPILSRNSIRYLTLPCANPLDHSLDVRQITWFSVFRYLKKFYEQKKQKPFKAPLGWLLRINQRNCFAHLRSYQKNFDFQNKAPEFQTLAIESPSALEQLIQKETLEKALDSLNDRKRRILKLFCEGKRDKSIAEEIGMTPANVRKTRLRALRTIEEQLQGKKQ